MSPSPTPTKSELRAAMRARRDAILPATAAAAADAAAAHALALPALQSTHCVSLYAAVRNELSTTPLARALAARGVTLVYPRVVRDERRLSFHSAGDPDELSPGTFGIPEPDALAPLVAPASLDAIVVPGLAFDARGNRLGWGHGYYDATLWAAKDAVRLGFAFDLQLVDIVPVEDGDAAMDCVITEAGARACHREP